MTRANKALVITVLTSLGLWGCSQEQNHGATNARIRALESKNAKLEEDFRAVVALRDQIRKKLGAAEQQIEQLQTVVRERDDLRQQIAARTNERDTVQNQFDQLRKGIRNLLGQAESVSLTNPGHPMTAASAARVDDRS
jgi:uncharacterized coiled-coil DUF342 family protein